MEAVKTISWIKTRSAQRLFAHKLQPYPDAHSSIGGELGYFDQRFWWNATGKAQEDFDAISTDFLEQLKIGLKHGCFTTLQFHLYMIGRELVSPQSAHPTIMFFCEQEKLRVRAKEIVNKGGLLEKLPGFRVGHRTRQPTVGRLVLPAEADEIPLHPQVQIQHEQVYFDPSSVVEALGMRIFVEHSKGSWRMATAYRVFRGGQYLLMSVSHVFTESVLDGSDAAMEEDSSCDYGSDTTSDEREQGFKRTEWLADAAVHPAPHIAALSSPVDKLRERYITDGNELELLGTLLQSSSDQDWALITVTNEYVLSVLGSDQAITTNSLALEISGPSRDVLCYMSRRGETTGVLSGSPTYIRLPGSSTFQAVYQVALKLPIIWGDCGVMVLDAETSGLYGHVVASSEDMRLAFIMPAIGILESSGTTWQALAPDREMRTVAERDLESRWLKTVPLIVAPHHSTSSYSRAIPDWDFERLTLSTAAPVDQMSTDFEKHSGNVLTRSYPNNALPNSSAGVSYFFHIQEMEERLTAPHATVSSIWVPTGALENWWYCDGVKIHYMPAWIPSQDVFHYKTVSTVYRNNRGFDILKADATKPPAKGDWSELSFDGEGATKSSVLTNTGTKRTLRGQVPGSWWPHMLLPSLYHGPNKPEAGNEGGLTGDLGIFLSLIALSIPPDDLLTQLPELMIDGEWVTHRGASRIDRRGVVVTVYASYNDKHQLEELERGRHGFYYR